MSPSFIITSSIPVEELSPLTTKFHHSCFDSSAFLPLTSVTNLPYEPFSDSISFLLSKSSPSDFSFVVTSNSSLKVLSESVTIILYSLIPSTALLFI